MALESEAALRLNMALQTVANLTALRCALRGCKFSEGHHLVFGRFAADVRFFAVKAWAQLLQGLLMSAALGQQEIWEPCFASHSSCQVS